MKKQKLLETVADIAYIAGQMKFYSGDSRADISNFIYWANEFEKKNLKTNWEEANYILAIQEFAKEKIENHSAAKNAQPAIL
ncbi:MAG: hypothetical protein HYU69_08865 [Bacteroidetes bacterium]|nr:hypothetical protein [Bacteroidota bacterium]